MDKNESAAAKEETPAKEEKGKDQPQGAPDSAPPYDPRDLGNYSPTNSMCALCNLVAV